MKQYHLNIFLICLCCMIGVKVSAYSFKVDGIYYNYNNDGTSVTVTSGGSYSDEYSGTVDIPAYVTYNGQAYIVTGIGNYAFQLSNITSIKIPTYVAFIGDEAFSGCSSLTSITVAAKNETYDSRDNCNAIIKTSTNTLIVGCKSTIIPNSITTIGKGAFMRCGNLNYVTIPNSVVNIEKEAFWNCDGLTSIIYPNSITAIGERAFSNCDNLKAVFCYADNVPAISWDTFEDTPIDDASLYVPSSSFEDYKSNILWRKFGTIKALDNLTWLYSPDTKSLSISGNGEMTDFSSSETPWSSHKEFIETIIIGDDISYIGDYAFYGCNQLKKVVMGSGLKAVGVSAFGECPSIEEVHVSDLAAWCEINFDISLDKYGTESYNSNPLCGYLFGSAAITGARGPSLYVNGEKIQDDLIIPDGVKIIKRNTFPCRWDIESITIPSSVEEIQFRAFYWCNKLKAVHISDLAAWCQISFRTGINYTYDVYTDDANPLIYAHNLYLNDEKITNLEIPKGLSLVSPFAFESSSIESVTFPNGLTSIGQGAFSNCYNLQSIVIPNTVSTIGANAFSDCLSLYSVTSLLNLPFNLDETAFQYNGTQYDKDIVYMAATLYVPRGRVPMYSSIQGWQKFLNIMETDTKFKLTYIVDGEEYKTYEIQATEVITPEPDPYKEGCIFSGWSEIPYLMPAHDVTVTGAFTIDTAIDQIMSNGKDDAMIYTIDGKRLSKPQRGLNIVRMSNGTTKKVVVK